MPYIPEEHEKYNLLPNCRKKGGEIFDYPEELLNIIEEVTGEDIAPFGYDSYEEYYLMLDNIIEKYSNDSIKAKLIDFKTLMLEMNQKEDWSIVRYLGESTAEDFHIGLTQGRCYYLPADKNCVDFRGIIDDEEWTTYWYDLYSEEWEIITDPTGVARAAIEDGDCAELLRAHEFSANHGPELRKDSVCGCFCCLEIFHPSEIKEWVAPKAKCDKRGTAICPYCSVDSIIGESSGYPITKEFLTAMHNYWFSDAK